MNLTEKILSCPSVPGDGRQMEELLKGELCINGVSFSKDALGNLFFTKTVTDGRNVMLCTGLDVGGVIATYVEGSKIYVNALGDCGDMQKIAYSKVVFDGISGILVPPDGFTAGTSLADCHVETYDKSAAEKVSLGSKGYFDIPYNKLGDDIYWGYGVAQKLCISRVCQEAEKLFGDDALLKKLNIGSVTVAFLGQSSLMSRGSSVAANSVNPDDVILVSPFDCKRNGKGIDSSDRIIVKILDKAYVGDTSLTEEICRYLEEKEIPFKKAVSLEANPVLANLSRADSCPRCAYVCLAAFHGGLMFNN